MFRVPPHKVGILGDTTAASVEEKAIDFVQNTVMPLAVNQESVFDALIPTADQGDVYTKHNLYALLRGNTQSQFAAFSIGRQNGFLSANDIRRLMDMEPIPNGDRYLEPLNMVEAGSGATGNPGTQTTRQAKEEHPRFAFMNSL